jgi:uncharacterized protein YndB with AHSA1/START domain
LKEQDMTERSVAHGVFTIERNYDHPVQRVYDAFATEGGKAAWFAGDFGYAMTERSFDFRVGGTERLAGRWPSGTVSRFDARYFDIIPGERIVYAYEMHIDERKISVSLATVEFRAEGEGTRLTVTEQGAFLDGYDDAGSREEGTRQLLERIAQALASASVGPIACH